MNKNSFESYSSYFQNLRDKTSKIENGIDKLSNIWRTPHLLVGGYGERPAEINTHLQELWTLIRDTNDAAKEFRVKEGSSEETDKFLHEAQTSYEVLKAQCDDIVIVFAEYGYCYEEREDSKDSMLDDHKNGNKDDTNTSILKSEEMEVEFTPDLTWRCKAKLRDEDTCNSNQEKPRATCIATPVIKSLRSISLSKNYEIKD